MMHYPSEVVLRFLEKETSIDVPFIATIEGEWEFADCDFFVWKGEVLELHTGGWSGNEDIIRALQRNKAFWKLLEKEEAGGHYYFKLKKKKED